MSFSLSGHSGLMNDAFAALVCESCWTPRCFPGGSGNSSGSGLRSEPGLMCLCCSV